MMFRFQLLSLLDTQHSVQETAIAVPMAPSPSSKSNPRGFPLITLASSFMRAWGFVYKNCVPLSGLIDTASAMVAISVKHWSACRRPAARSRACRAVQCCRGGMTPTDRAQSGCVQDNGVQKNHKAANAMRQALAATLTACALVCSQTLSTRCVHFKHSTLTLPLFACPCFTRKVF